MSDIFREVDEDLRHQRYVKLWQQYGVFIVGGAIAIAVSVLVFSGLQSYAQNKRDKASDQFLAARKLQTEQGDPLSALAAYERLEKSAPGGYKVLTRFASAEALLAAGDADKALAEYDAIAADGGIPPEFRDLARIKGGMLVLGTVSATEMRTRLSTTMSNDNTWHASAVELVAFSLYKDGNLEAASQEYLTLIADTTAPPNLRTRAEEMLKVIGRQTAEQQGAEQQGTEQQDAAQPGASSPPTDQPN